jgi:regulator of protease activity HflC (stomatin/prohibitin superfamily)
MVQTEQASQLVQASQAGDRPIAERPARHSGGLVMIPVAIVLLAVGIVLVILASQHTGGAKTALGVVDAVVWLCFVLILPGFTAVAPGHARVVQLFGKYWGTIRQPGLQFVNPLTKRVVVSTRIRNQESPQIKVNDADGNPVEIAAVVVWRVQDTAKAVYAVDDYVKFVSFQTETAIRHIASGYPYDSRGSDRLSLRENTNEITAQLDDELRNRVAPAGVEIIESRLTRLSYAPEIAQAMLRRQQASAVVGARQVIVEGAVGMVQLALNKLESEGVVELDEERKAAMVSNLLVVLCSEQATQQVVNTGSLYQ